MEIMVGMGKVANWAMRLMVVVLVGLLLYLVYGCSHGPYRPNVESAADWQGYSKWSTLLLCKDAALASPHVRDLTREHGYGQVDAQAQRLHGCIEDLLYRSGQQEYWEKGGMEEAFNTCRALLWGDAVPGVAKWQRRMVPPAAAKEEAKGQDVIEGKPVSEPQALRKPRELIGGTLLYQEAGAYEY